MTGFPAILTHNFHPGYPPFGNLCDLPKREAAALVRQRGSRSSYLDRRYAVEHWLAEASRGLLGGTRRRRPVYLFLGDFADGLDPNRPLSLVLRLADIPADSLTFTYPDSMTSLLLATQLDLAAQRRDHHGQVFTLAGIKDLVARIGMPERRWPREPGAASDGFVEAQLWDDAPLRAALHAPTPELP